MKKISFLIIIAIIGIVFIALKSGNSSSQNANFKNIDAIEFKQLCDAREGIILDIRTPNEFNSGHIKNAINIDYYNGNFKSELGKIEKNTPVYIYCRSGNRSGKSMAVFNELGFQEVYNLQDGIVSWLRPEYILQTD